jgi:predicted deacylase
MKRDHMDRVLRAPKAGLVRPVRAIGDIVKKGT